MTDSGQHERIAPSSEGEAKSPDQIRAEIEQTREEFGDTVEALAAKADVKAQAQDRIEAVKDTVADNVSHAKETLTGKKDEFATRARQVTPDSAGAGAQHVGTAVQSHPLPYAAVGAFAGGLLLGWLLARR